MSLPKKFKVRQDVMAAQNAYLARGMIGPSPDKDLELLPEGSAKEFVRSGFVPKGMWMPSLDEAMALSSDEICSRQSQASFVEAETSR